MGRQLLVQDSEELQDVAVIRAKVPHRSARGRININCAPNRASGHDRYGNVHNPTKAGPLLQRNLPDGRYFMQHLITWDFLQGRGDLLPAFLFG